MMKHFLTGDSLILYHDNDNQCYNVERTIELFDQLYTNMYTKPQTHKRGKQFMHVLAVLEMYAFGLQNILLRRNENTFWQFKAWKWGYFENAFRITNKPFTAFSYLDFMGIFDKFLNSLHDDIIG